MIIYQGTSCLPYVDEICQEEDKAFPEYAIGSSAVACIIKMDDYISTCIRSESDRLQAFLGAKIVSHETYELFKDGALSEEELLSSSISNLSDDELFVYFSSVFSKAPKTPALACAFSSFFEQLDQLSPKRILGYFAIAGTVQGEKFMTRIGFGQELSDSKDKLYSCWDESVVRRMSEYDLLDHIKTRQVYLPR